MPGKKICQPENLTQEDPDAPVIRERQPLTGTGDPYVHYSQETTNALNSRPARLKLCLFIIILTITKKSREFPCPSDVKCTG
jgi:hypothetical protein